MVGRALFVVFLLSIPWSGYGDLDKTVLPSKSRKDGGESKARLELEGGPKQGVSGSLGVGQNTPGGVAAVNPPESPGSKAASRFADKKSATPAPPKLGPIRWRADKLDVNDQNLTGTLVGAVRVFREDFDLRADKAIFFYKKGPERELDRIEAFGKVRMKKLDLTNGLWTTGHSNTAEYFAEEQVLWLRGEAFVFRDKDKLFGDELKYNLATNQVEGSSVRGVANVKN